MSRNSTESGPEPLIFTPPKAGLLASPPTITNRTSFAILTYATHGYFVQPAVCLDGSGGGSLLSTASIGFDPVSGNYVTNTSLIGFAIQMYPSGSFTNSSGSHYLWSTQITELLTAYPVLSLTRAGTNAVLSWPVTFNLESNTHLPATNSWSVVTGSFTTNNGVVSIQVPLSGSAKFFRLHKP